ncbi:hypothetical protein EV424DRAFT_880892 [Suillus variegatus]|nr:hypothetical protein EV424DRAFT_880892 [Suillus variegatus]
MGMDREPRRMIRNNASLSLELFGAKAAGDHSVGYVQDEERCIPTRLEGVFEDKLTAESVFRRDWRETRLPAHSDVCAGSVVEERGKMSWGLCLFLDCRSPGREGRHLLRQCVLGDRSAQYVVVQGCSQVIGLPFLLESVFTGLHRRFCWCNANEHLRKVCLNLIPTARALISTHIASRYSEPRPQASYAPCSTAVCNSALPVDLDAVRSIKTSVQTGNGGPSNYEGQSAGFWFILACISVAALAVWVFYHADTARGYV